MFTLKAEFIASAQMFSCSKTIMSYYFCGGKGGGGVEGLVREIEDLRQGGT